jgi:hypothetical protein
MSPLEAAPGDMVQHEDGRWARVVPRSFPFGITVSLLDGEGKPMRGRDIWMAGDVVARVHKRREVRRLRRKSREKGS